VCQIAVDAGATTLNIPDTVGFAVPEDYAKLIRYVIDTVNGDFVVSTHCHNDLGLAVANSLAGVSAGARQVECAINGLGERAGNAALEEVVMAIRTRRDHFSDVDVNTHSEELARTSRMVARLTGYHVQYNKAVVGRNAFAHEAGIHQHGVLADRETYEIIDASTVGQEAAQIVLGKHSGRHAFADTLEKMGIHVQGDALNRAFVRFKELADKKVDITEADLEAIIAEEIGSGLVHRYGLLELEVRGGTNTPPTARVIVTDADDKIEATGTGDGMIDAAIAAIVEATGVPGKVGNFQVSSVTGGSDALGAVTITVEAEGHKVTGRGVATDVVEASARAYLNAVNKFVRMRERGDEVREPMVGP
jgi:2-isopropylmalate synthase